MNWPKLTATKKLYSWYPKDKDVTSKSMRNSVLFWSSMAKSKKTFTEITVEGSQVKFSTSSKFINLSTESRHLNLTTQASTRKIKRERKKKSLNLTIWSAKSKGKSPKSKIKICLSSRNSNLFSKNSTSIWFYWNF